MLQIRGHNIYIIRGDTGGLDLTILSPECKELDGYTATLSVKKSFSDSSYTLQKTSETGRFIFTNDDTKDLSAGVYKYDIQITIPGENGSIDQVQTIGPGNFVVLADVTK